MTKSSTASPRKQWHIGGRLDPEIHFQVDRPDFWSTVAKRLASQNNLILYAHRQAGKSSSKAPIRRKLEEINCVVIAADFQSLSNSERRSESDVLQQVWRTLCTAAKLDIESIEHDIEALQRRFAKCLTEATVLFIDEFDCLLVNPAAAATVLRTLREWWSEKRFRSILAIGVHRIKTMVNTGVGDPASPFNILDATECPLIERTQFEKTFQEMADIYFESEALADTLTEFNAIRDDIWCRAGGHVAFISLLGYQLQELIETGGECTEQTWRRLVTGPIQSRVADTPIVSQIISRLNSAPPAVIAALIELLRGPADGIVIRDSSSASWLEAEGLARRSNRTSDGATLLWFPTTIMRRTLYRYLVEHRAAEEQRHNSSVLEDLTLTLAPGMLQRTVHDDGSVEEWEGAPLMDNRRSILAALPWLNLPSIWARAALCQDGRPSEYSVHFSLFAVMQRMALNSQWLAVPEARDANGPNARQRLDICFQSNGTRSGIEIMRHGLETDLEKHLEQALSYKTVLRLSSVTILCVHFSDMAPELRRGWMFRPSEYDGIEVMHVVLPNPSIDGNRPMKTMISVDPADDDVITSQISDEFPSRVCDVEQRMSTLTLNNGLPWTDDHHTDDDTQELVAWLNNMVINYRWPERACEVLGGLATLICGKQSIAPKATVRQLMQRISPCPAGTLTIDDTTTDVILRVGAMYRL